MQYCFFIYKFLPMLSTSKIITIKIPFNLSLPFEKEINFQCLMDFPKVLFNHGHLECSCRTKNKFLFSSHWIQFSSKPLAFFLHKHKIICNSFIFNYKVFIQIFNRMARKPEQQWRFQPNSNILKAVHFQWKSNVPNRISLGWEGEIAGGGGGERKETETKTYEPNEQMPVPLASSSCSQFPPNVEPEAASLPF